MPGRNYATMLAPTRMKSLAIRATSPFWQTILALSVAHRRAAYVGLAMDLAARGAKPRARLDAEKARTMRALRERRPCQRERHTLGGRPRSAAGPPNALAGNGGAKPRARLDAEKARTMRALRERRPCQRERHTLRPQGEPSPVPAPRGMCHQRCTHDGVDYGVWGGAPSGGVQRAAARPLLRSTGAHSPRKLSWGAGPRSPRKPSRGARGRIAPESSRGARGRKAPRKLSWGAGPRRPRQSAGNRAA